ncbi:MAG: hypothetical protein FWC32_10000 [Firmicutes bacterium]|nr:hypothetical protein [Bacillota bacterium]
MKSLINTALLQEQLKRFWVIAVVPMLIYLLSIVVPLHNAGHNTIGPQQSRFMLNILTMGYPTIIFAMVLVPFCVAMALYPYNFNSTATSAFYTFPVTKRQLFWTNFAAGAILILLPLLVLSLILLVPIYFNPGYQFSYWEGVQSSWRNVHLPHTLFPNDLAEGAVMNTFRQMAGFFARAAIGFMFYYGVFLIAVNVAGNRVVSVLLCGALPFIPVAVHGLFWGIGMLYVFGTSGVDSGRQIVETLLLTNPVIWMVVIGGQMRRFLGLFFIRGGGQSGLMLYYIFYTVSTAVFLAIAYVCSCKRKLERTGDSVVFTSLKNVLVFILSMAGMVMMGIFGIHLLESRFGMYLGGIIGFVLFYFIAQMIAEKSFNVVGQKAKSLIYFGGTIIGIYLVMFIVTTFGMGFYVNRVPARAEIEGVALQRWNYRVVPITEPEIIDRTIEIHNTILDNRGYLRRLFWQNIRADIDHRNFEIAYRLTDGTYIHRRYIVSTRFRRQHGIDDLFREPSVILANYPGLQRPEIIESVNITFDVREGEVWSHHNKVIIDQQLISSLIEAIKADYLTQLARRSTDSAGNVDTHDEVRWFGFSLRTYEQGRFDSCWVSLDAVRVGRVIQWLDGHWGEDNWIQESQIRRW